MTNTPDRQPSQGPRVSVIIPAYNEAANLYSNLAAVAEHLAKAPFTWEIVVIDDGSGDATAAEARRFASTNSQVTVVEHPTNLRIGHALKTGFATARGQWIVTFDADLSYHPEHIVRMVAAIESTRAKVVVASPYMKGGSISGVPRLRALLSRVANRLLRHLSNSRVSTITGMVRAYDRAFVTNLSLKSVDNQINAEIVYKTDLLRERIVEIPAHLQWTRNEADTQSRKGNFSIIRTTIDFLFSGFIFRPFMFFLLPGAILSFLALYALGWAGYHTLRFYSDQQGGLEDRLSAALAEAFALSPHSFVVGGLAMVLALQLVTLGMLAAQSKRYFEELYFQGMWLSRRLDTTQNRINAQLTEKFEGTPDQG